MTTVCFSAFCPTTTFIDAIIIVSIKISHDEKSAIRHVMNIDFGSVLLRSIDSS